MSKFKCGDKVRIKDHISGYSQPDYSQIFTYGVGGDWDYTINKYEDDFEIVEENKQRHIHYDMIVEWAKDPSRIVQFYDDEYYDCGWKDVVGQPPMWYTDKLYRFKPAEPERVSLAGVFPVTSFTDDELYTVVAQGDSLCTADDYRNVANAAIKCYILEQEKK